jgi:succinate-semialdehyde dehydrogenase/glutarate-semialdehyde dehydrogenase
MSVADDEEAIRLANDTRYGLGASVFSRDPHRANEIAKRICSGSVCINDMSMTYGALEAPFGGRKDSGIGQVNGETGLKSYCYAQPILQNRFARGGAGGYPYSRKRDEGMQRFMRLLWGTPIGRWLS